MIKLNDISNFGFSEVNKYLDTNIKCYTFHGTETFGLKKNYQLENDI